MREAGDVFAVPISQNVSLTTENLFYCESLKFFHKNKISTSRSLFTPLVSRHTQLTPRNIYSLGG